jgi:hypothetical protein
VRHGIRCAGLVLIRLRHGDAATTADAIVRVINVEGRNLTRSLVVIDKDRTRVLRLA